MRTNQLAMATEWLLLLFARGCEGCGWRRKKWRTFPSQCQRVVLFIADLSHTELILMNHVCGGKNDFLIEVGLAGCRIS